MRPKHRPASPSAPCRHARWWAAAWLLAAAGCAPVAPAPAPPVAAPARFGDGSAWRVAPDLATAELPSAWWTLFGDAALTRLEEQALRANQSLAAAAAARAAALAVAAEREAALLPTLSLSAATAHERLPDYQPRNGKLDSYARGRVGAAAAASWEPDLWGRQGGERDAGRAWAASAEARLAGQALSITALLAENYFQLRQLDAGIELTQALRGAAAALEQMTEADLKQGRASRDDALQARAELDLIDARLAPLRRDRARCEHALALLTGQGATGFSLAPLAAYAPPLAALPPTLPSQLLERRPDIVGARQAMAATAAERQTAAAAFFPRIVLGASGGAEGADLRRLLNLPVAVWSLGASLGEQLYDGGARAARLAGADARVDEQAARYRDIVLAAFQEVEDGLAAAHFLSARDGAAERYAHKQGALLESRRRLAKAGLASRRDVLQARRRALEAELDWRLGQGETLRNKVALIKALGGGWQAPAAGAAP